jgi:hypothetical protein
VHALISGSRLNTAEIMFVRGYLNRRSKSPGPLLDLRQPGGSG